MINLKNLFKILLAIIMISTQAYAVDCESDMCPSVPQKINGPVSSVLSKVTGMNWILSSVIESQVKKQMDKALLGDFKVNITPYGGKSLLDGKFKKMTAHSDYSYIEGLYLSDVNAESVCEYNHFIYKDGQVYTNENFILSYSVSVTSDDLQKTVATPQYLKLLNSMKVSVGNISVFKIFDPKAEIKNNRMVFSLKVISPLTLGEPKRISTDMGLEVEDGKIMFTDVRTTPNLTSVNLNSILPVINKLNPFVYKANIMNNSKSIIKVQNVNINDNKIVITGLVIVPKNYYNN
ncbi:MAG: hypothetical protein KHX03_00665 [Clostridium sp.]|nr:hypothetical protein [Clostridium sp.]